MEICFMLHVFNGFVPLFLTLLAVSADEVLKTGEQVGTSSNQVLLGMLVVVLIVVVVYLGRKQDKASRAFEMKQDTVIREQEKRHDMLVARLEAEQRAFGEERRQRIEFLMKLVADVTVALNRTATAETAMANSVDALKLALHTNTEVTRQLCEVMKSKSIGEQLK